MDRTKIIIADDHLLFAEGLEKIIAAMTEFEVIDSVSNGKQLLHLLHSKQPDMILMDISMPVLDGLQAAIAIRKSHPEMKIIFVSMYQHAKLMAQAKELGAYGFIMKDTTAPDLKLALLRVRNGDKVFPNLVEQMPVLSDSVNSDPFMNQFKLSVREIEIIKLIKKGMPTKQIAAELQLSIYTVETHRKNINRKLQVQSPTELLALLATYSFG